MVIKDPDYYLDGFKQSHGIFTSSTIERMPFLSEKAKNDIKCRQDTLAKLGVQSAEMIRPVHRSQFNPHKEYFRAFFRCGIILAILRELPIINFYARCFIMGISTYVLIDRENITVINPTGRNFGFKSHFTNDRELMNFPILRFLACYRRPTTNVPTMMPEIEWRKRNYPLYYQPHDGVLEQFIRIPRYIKWDGTMNMPLLPFISDVGTGVASGTYAVNFSTHPYYK